MLSLSKNIKNIFGAGTICQISNVIVERVTIEMPDVSVWRLRA